MVRGFLGVVILSGVDYDTEDREAFRQVSFEGCPPPAWKVVCHGFYEFWNVDVP
ncbi:MAG: hypothetical protein HOH43_20125 [Candidatus Latescibacteria bacterium]|nr:hypothetical protein [Candidatus Latescibacterota bacterium]